MTAREFFAEQKLSACPHHRVLHHAAGLQPLSHSYTAVIHGFLREGDIDRAEAVYASNRRAGVASDTSWAAITTAFFKAKNAERAMALLQQASGGGCAPNVVKLGADERVWLAAGRGGRDAPRQGPIRVAHQALLPRRTAGRGAGAPDGDAGAGSATWQRSLQPARDRARPGGRDQRCATKNQLAARSSMHRLTKK